VKAYGTSARGQDLWLEVRQIEEARTNPDNFWLYIVENVRQENPEQFRLLRFGGEPLVRLLDRAVERRYFTVRFPVAVYDAAVVEQRRRAVPCPASVGCHRRPSTTSTSRLSSRRASSVGAGVHHEACLSGGSRRVGGKQTFLVAT